MENKLQVEYVSISAIKPYARNAKTHPKEQVDQIVKSIEEFGFNDPIALWKGEIVEGHGRYLAAMQMGIDTVPVIRLDNLTDEQRKAYALVHNKLTMNSDFDIDLLNLELGDIDLDMSVYGFLEDENEEPEEVEDDYDPDPPAEPKAKRGEIYRLGRHRLMCGDSTDSTDVSLLMGGGTVDMVFTDPPYGMNLDTDYSSMKNHLDSSFNKEKGIKGGRKYEKGMVDDFSPDMIDTIQAINASEVFLWGADYYAELLKDRNAGSWIVWDKRANGNDDIEEDYSSDRIYGSCFELCWSKKRHKRDIARIKWAGVFGTEQEPDRKRYHPTQKPVGLSRWFISRYSKDEQSVLDLFGGSGSTLIACEQLNRTCYMMELDPRYVDVIIDRWEKFTGQKAERIATSD